MKLTFVWNILTTTGWIAMKLDPYNMKWYSESSSRALSRPKLSLVQSNISTSNWWIAMKFCSEIHGSPRMTLNNLGDPLTSSGTTMRLTFLVVIEISQKARDVLPWKLLRIFMVPTGGIVITLIPYVSNTLVYDQIPVKSDHGVSPEGAFELCIMLTLQRKNTLEM